MFYSGEMEEARKSLWDRLRRGQVSPTTRATVTGVMSVELARLSGAHGWLPMLPAGILAFSLIVIATYWFQPRPEVSFATWTFQWLLVSAVLLAGVWAVPKLLSGSIWLPIADALPLSAAVFLLGLLPTPFRPHARRMGATEWAIFSLALGLIVALFDLFIR
jgi:hypothetical protein